MMVGSGMSELYGPLTEIYWGLEEVDDVSHKWNHHLHCPQGAIVNGVIITTNLLDVINASLPSIVWLSAQKKLRKMSH